MPQTIHLHDRSFKLLLPYSKISEVIEKMAKKMNSDFETKKPLFLVVLKGAFMFASELVQAVQRDIDIEFIRVKSYDGMDNSGGIDCGLNQKLKVEGRTVVILEDIVDTGNTIEYLNKELQKMGASNVHIATLFLKPDAYKKDLKLDYVGLEIPNEFVVGFGLDYDERGRGFKDLYTLIK